MTALTSSWAEPARRPGEPSGLWSVYEDYELNGNIIRPSGNIKESYSPLDDENLPSFLAKLGSADEADLLAFVRRFGLVGSGDTDTLENIRTHARQVSVILELTAHLTDRSTGSISALRNYLRSQPGGYRLSPEHIKGQPQFLAYRLRAMLLNSQIQDVQPRVFVAGESEDRELPGRTSRRKAAPDELVFTFDSLVQAVYWILATKGRKEIVRRCAYCDQPFIAREPERHRYCPRPRGERGGSLCSIAARNQRRKPKQEMRGGKGATK
jgi:hypothetical protein